MKQILLSTFFLTFLLSNVFAQSENLSNAQIIEMTKVGLSKEIILTKIRQSNSVFDVTTDALIELKKANVDNEIITLLMEKSKENLTAQTQPTPSKMTMTNEVEKEVQPVVSPKQSLLSAKTIAIEKSSIYPSRQSLEKALFKRKEWKNYNLTILRYKDQADLYIEIGRIPLTLITNRYVFRVYDRRNGVVITAGETTAWGSLAENMAREIMQKLKKVSEK
jgi:hypothetical protein